MPTHTPIRSLLLAAACLSSACARHEASRDTTPAAGAATSSTSPPSAWVVTPRGLGPLTAGMTRSEAEAALGVRIGAPTDSAWTQCAYLTTNRLPAGVRVMVENRSIARIDVDSGSTATAAGARIGDTEAHVAELYAGRVVTTPAKYGGGHYLTVTPAAPADSAYRIIFETDGQRVTRYRAGRLPAVAYVERCG